MRKMNFSNINYEYTQLFSNINYSSKTRNVCKYLLNEILHWILVYINKNKKVLSVVEFY